MTKAPQITRWECDSIQISHAKSTFEEFSSFKSHHNDGLVRLHFGLKGDYSFGHEQLNQRFDLIGGHHNIMFSEGMDIEVRNKSLMLETFGINFPKETFIKFTEGGDDILKAFSDDVLEGKPSLLSKNWGAVNPEIQIVIDEILHNRFHGRMADIFLLAKSMELLVLCVENYQQTSKSSLCYVKSKSDKERVMAARDFVNDRLQEPPNLSEIARAIGMNEFKLKHGFKEMFGSTIFGYLTDRRLHLARQSLLNTDKTVSEVSGYFGYSSPQHFSTQFRKKFGTTPKSIRNNP